MNELDAPTSPPPPLIRADPSSPTVLRAAPGRGSRRRGWAARAILTASALAAAVLLGQTAPAQASGELGFSAVELPSHPRLVAVACAPSAGCLVLPAHGPTSTFEHGRWRALASPTPFPGASRLSLACASSIACVTASATSGEVATWNGRTWSAPYALPGAGPITALGCSASGYCAAVDAVGNAYALDAGGWRRTSGDWGSVEAIACLGASFCFSASANGISRWDGAAWTMPSELGTTASFAGVACTSPSACLAVDSAGEALGWNGRAWAPTARLEPTAASVTVLAPAPTALACAAPRACLAVDDTGAVLQEQGTHWQRRHLRGASALRAVSCSRAALCLALDSRGELFLGRSH